MSEQKDKSRDAWDKLGTISVFLSSVVIAAAGLIINSSFSERQSQRTMEAQEKQHQLAKVQALSVFMPHLSGNIDTREAAIYAITALGYPELAVRLNQVGNNKAESNDKIMRSAPASIAPTSVQADKTDAAAWLYLGDYDNGWKTYYLGFSPTMKPEDLVGKTFDVRNQTGAINLRSGMPTDNGEFPKVVKTLKEGSKVNILEVKQWLTSGYTWARVKYAD